MNIEDEVAFTVRIPQELRDKIDEQRKVEHRSRNAQIIHILTQYFSQQDDRRERAFKALQGPSQSEPQ